MVGSPGTTARVGLTVRPVDHAAVRARPMAVATLLVVLPSLCAIPRLRRKQAPSLSAGKRKLAWAKDSPFRIYFPYPG